MRFRRRTWEKMLPTPRGLSEDLPTGVEFCAEARGTIRKSTHVRLSGGDGQQERRVLEGPDVLSVARSEE